VKAACDAKLHVKKCGEKCGEFFDPPKKLTAAKDVKKLQENR
jgi:hypothetical protein